MPTNEIDYRRARGALIIGYKRTIELIESEINNFAKRFIPDFHFMDHKVSTFWRCDASPIGMCVFNLSERGDVQDCRYCGDPEERK